MCGIYGYYSDQYKHNKLDVFKKIGKSLRHRGPDHEGEYVDGVIALGIQRLSVIDPEKGNQPIFSNNKLLVIVHNGEIYNYKSLRNKLESKGYNFKTNTDTEVIVNMYQDKGAECLKDLNGMFAFAIYNIENKELFIARDRFGIKPLYYFKDKNKFIFSSELKGIQTCKDIELDLSFEAIDLYLSMEYVPAPFTIYKNIFKLEQGHYLHSQNGSFKKEKWYELSYQPKFNLSNENDYLEKLDYLIKESVQLRTISDVPLGAFLSGGIDSSIITSYLCSNNNNLNSFSIGFEDESFDESNYSRTVSQHLKTNHHEEIFSADRMAEMLPSIWDMMDEPFADASLLPTYLLSSFTKQFVTVSISGDGGDEVFAGYPTYFAHKIAKWIPSWSVQSLQYVSTFLPVSFDNISFDFKVKQFCKGLSYTDYLRHQYWLGSFNHKQKETLYNPLFRDGVNRSNGLDQLLSTHMSNNDTENNWEKHLYQDMRFYLQDNMLVKVDRSSMAHSLEVRVPYLDHNIVEFMARVPSRLKYKGFESKYLLKKLARKYLPDEIVDRPKKGFGIPIAKWFCGPLKKEINEIITDPNSFINTYFNQNITSRLLDDHLTQKSDNRKLLWTLFVLENWIKNNHFMGSN